MRPWKEKEHSALFSFVFGLTKLCAFVSGFAVVTIAMTALLGGVIETFFFRFTLALIIVIIASIGLSLGVSARPERASVVTDLLAIVWVAVSVAVCATPFGRELLAEEASRLRKADHETLAGFAGWLAKQEPAERVVTVAAIPEPAEPATEPAEPTVEPPAEGAGAPKIKPAEPEPEPEPEEKAAEPTEPEAEKELTPSEIFKQFAPSVVSVLTGGVLSGGSGTGFIIDEQGTIVTNDHVIRGDRIVRVRLFDGTEISKVRLLETDPKEDLALLRIETDAALVPVQLGESETVAVGERVISIGNPLGLDHTLTDGVVSSRRMLRGRKVLQMSAPVSPGNSGGPVFNMRGEVIGVTFAIYGPSLAQNVNLAVPIDTLKAMLKPEYPDARKFGRKNW